MTKIRSNAKKLEREVLALSRHIKDASSPFLGTWEADLLTRLIEVSYIHQTEKFPHGVSIGETNFAERDVLSRAYSNAARRVKLTTIIRLGLEEKHYEAVQNYSDVSEDPLAMNAMKSLPTLVSIVLQVVVYRSPNPFDTERPFARWLVQEGMEKPDKFAFWARLYPVCYGRSVYESANLI